MQGNDFGVTLQIHKKIEKKGLDVGFESKCAMMTRSLALI